MPGLEDSDATNEYPNVTAINMILTNAASVKIVLMISKGQIEENRGATLFQGLGRIVSMITDAGIKNSKDFIVPVICRGTFGKNRGDKWITA